MNRGFGPVTPVLSALSAKTGIPLSTLKDNAKALRDMGIIEFGNSSEAKATAFGRKILILLGGKKPDGTVRVSSWK